MAPSGSSLFDLVNFEVAIASKSNGVRDPAQLEHVELVGLRWLLEIENDTVGKLKSHLERLHESVDVASINRLHDRVSHFGDMPAALRFDSLREVETRMSPRWLMRVIGRELATSTSLEFRGSTNLRFRKHQRFLSLS